MNIEDGLSLLLFAFEQENDSLLYMRWIVGAQFQMGFDEFKDALIPKIQKSDKEILDDAEKILTSFYGGEQL